MKIAYQPHDYCGICPYFKNIIYYENYKEFEATDMEEPNVEEDIFCGFFFFPVKITKEEYDNIPEWCPLDDYKEVKK